MWRIWWAPKNVSKWQMGFNSEFKGLICGSTVHRVMGHSILMLPLQPLNKYQHARNSHYQSAFMNYATPFGHEECLWRHEIRNGYIWVHLNCCAGGVFTARQADGQTVTGRMLRNTVHRIFRGFFSSAHCIVSSSNIWTRQSVLLCSNWHCRVTLTGRWHLQYGTIWRRTSPSVPIK